MTTPANVVLETRNSVSIITFNRPQRRNGITPQMCEDFFDAVLKVSTSSVPVLVVRGAGRDFCVGADIAPVEHDDIAQDNTAEPASPELQGRIYHASTLLHTMPQVTIAAIDGGCAGAGMGWAMACDMRIATTRARFSTAFVNVGVSGDMGLAWLLDRLVGTAKARELMFLGERFGGEDALSMGLVNRLVEPDTLSDSTMDMAMALAGRDPLALRLMKANFNSAAALPLPDYIDIETSRHLRTTRRPEFAQYIARRQAAQRREG